MPQPIGITFSPTPDQASMGKKNLSVAGGVPEAIQILSLHVPKFAGARPLAPEQLLNAPKSDRVSSVVESVLRSMGIDAASSGSPAPSMAPPATGGAPSESQGLAQMLSNATGGGVHPGATQRYEPTPSVTPGLDPVVGAPTQKSWPPDTLRQIDTSRIPRTTGWDYRG